MKGEFNIKKVVEVQKFHYGNFNVIYSFLESLQNRELALLVPYFLNEEQGKRNIRTLKCHNLQSFNFIYSRLAVFKRETIYNLYYSLAKYKKGLPKQDLYYLKRDNTEWIKNHWKEMESYDFVIDIDAGSFDDLKYAYLSVCDIHVFLDLCKCPHEVIYSGKGFHIIINGHYFNQYHKGRLEFNPKSKDSIYKFYVNIAKYFQENYCEMIDTKIYDSRRVLKIPFTLAIYEDSVRLCRPFYNTNEILSFELEQITQPLLILNCVKGRHTFHKKGSVNNMLKKIGVEL